MIRRLDYNLGKEKNKKACTGTNGRQEGLEITAFMLFTKL